MTNCKECGRQINEGKKRCTYCQSKMVPITAKKIFNKTKDTSVWVAKKTTKTSSNLTQKASEEIAKIKTLQQQNSLENKKKKVAKLQQQIEKEESSTE